MPGDTELIVAPSAEQLSDDVAGRLISTLVAAQAVRPLAFLAVTAGSIIDQMFTALAGRADRDAIDWSRVSLWWADERFVPADSADRNDRPAFAALFDHVALDPVNVHRMPATDGAYGDDAAAAAAGYAADLAAAVPSTQGDGDDIPYFDVILLGVGPDGHCASLFPNHPATLEVVAAVVDVHDSPKPPPTRLSFSFRALDSAHQVWFVAAGSGKADAVALAHSGAPREQIPSAGPRGMQCTLWLVDQAAASKLPDAS